MAPRGTTRLPWPSRVRAGSAPAPSGRKGRNRQLWATIRKCRGSIFLASAVSALDRGRMTALDDAPPQGDEIGDSSPVTRRFFATGWRSWSGRRDSNPRPSAWEARCCGGLRAAALSLRPPRRPTPPPPRRRSSSFPPSRTCRTRSGSAGRRGGSWSRTASPRASGRSPHLREHVRPRGLGDAGPVRPPPAALGPARMETDALRRRRQERPPRPLRRRRRPGAAHGGAAPPARSASPPATW